MRANNIKDLIEQHKLCVEKVYASDYYIATFNKVKTFYEEQHKKILDDLQPIDIIAFWNDFWFDLPDSPAIHRYPFYDICDLAEANL
jgi:hypothetical protein